LCQFVTPVSTHPATPPRPRCSRGGAKWASNRSMNTPWAGLSLSRA
jgi:hypothetical protein